MAEIVQSSELPRGVHLVGSIRLPNEPDDPLEKPPSPKEIFETIAKDLPHRLRRMPDGETGNRHYFVNWQERVFAPSPWILNDYERHLKSITVPEGDYSSKEIKLGTTGYDELAIQSFSAFSALQQQGTIDPSVRFQVGIPTPANVITRFIRPEYQTKIDPLYESLLQDAIRSLQSQIPPEKLAIQFDCALDFAMLEGVTGPGDVFKPWFDVTPQALVDRMARLADVVDPRVQIGFHLCYGDLMHRHFVEPKDMGNLVEMANRIVETLVHPVTWFHMPVPKEREDEGYFAPLEGLRLKDGDGTEIYLGLAHPRDREGMERRITAARRVLPRFGIATECGWGRTPVGDVGSIVEMLREFSAEV